MNDTKLSIIEMMKKDAIELVIVKLDKSKTYPKGNGLLEDGIYRYLYQPCEQHGDQKEQDNDFI